MKILKWAVLAPLAVVGCLIGLVSLAFAGTPDCIPLGGDALFPSPAWLPATLQPFWGEIVTVPLAAWILAHVRAVLPNDPRLSILLSILDKLVGNYGHARNAG